MRRPDRRAIRFVKALLPAGSGRRTAEGDYAAVSGKGETRLAERDVRELIAAGVLAGDAVACRPAATARQWLKRAMLETDAFAAQHRDETHAADGTTVNLAESPLARLAAPASGQSEAFLAPHQVEAGERVRRLAERAQLQPRVTMSYSGAHTAGGGGASRAADITDLAAEARKALAEIPRVLPRDCAGVVLDVCGLSKGLQVVEKERGWPRRCAKLVLRIGLEQLAQHYGLSPEAVGVELRRRHAWLGEGARPERFD